MGFKDMQMNVDRNSSDLKNSVYKTTNNLKSDLNQANTNNLMGFKDVLMHGDRLSSDIRNDISTQGTHNLIGFKNSELMIEKSRADIMLQSSQQYAAIQLEQSKNKEGLASQAAQNFAINQLEQHKIKESLAKELFDAKYEALKNKDALSMQLAECCC